MSGFRAVGRVKDAHGLKGEIWVVLFAGQADWLDDLKTDSQFSLSTVEDVDGKSDGEFQKYALKGVRAHKNGLILQSPSIVDRTAAEKLKGQFLVIPEDYLVGEEGADLFLSEIEGFAVFAATESGAPRAIGKVVAFAHNGGHDSLVVELVANAVPGADVAELEVEIPFVDEMVAHIDMDQKTITMKFPEGLLEVQLGLDKGNDDQTEDVDDFDDDEVFDDDEESETKS